MENIKGALKALRKKKKFTQHNVAIKLGLSDRAYGKIEAGETSLNISRLRDIAAVFDFTLAQLLANLLEEDITPQKSDTITLIRHYEETIILLKQQNETLKKILLDRTPSS
jgi:transcriptional regulator with XRE-family HTH domain